MYLYPWKGERVQMWNPKQFWPSAFKHICMISICTSYLISQAPENFMSWPVRQPCQFLHGWHENANSERIQLNNIISLIITRHVYGFLNFKSKNCFHYLFLDPAPTSGLLSLQIVMEYYSIVNYRAHFSSLLPYTQVSGCWEAAVSWIAELEREMVLSFQIQYSAALWR